MHTLEQLRSGALAGARRLDLSADLHTLPPEVYGLADTLEHPAVQLLRRALASPAWPHALAELPGYTAHQAGDVLSLTRALPWWHFKQPKQHRRCGAKRQQPGNALW